MIIGLLRSRNTLLQFMLFLIIAVAAWTPLFLHDIQIQHHDAAPLYRFFSNLLMVSPPWVAKLTVVFIQMVLLLIVSFSVNRIGLLSGKNTPVLFVFFIAINYLQGGVAVNPQLFALPFIIPSITALFVSLKEQNPHQKIFNAGFWAGLAALIYVPSLLLLVLAWAALLLLQLYNIRLWIIYAIAIALPAGYLLLFAWLFGDAGSIYEGFEMLESIAMSWASVFNADYYAGVRKSEIVTMVSFSIIFLLAIGRVLLRINERVIIERRFYRIMVWYVIIFLLGIVFSGGYPYNHLLLLSFGAGIFIGECFLLAGRTRLLNILLMIVVCSLMFSRLNIF